MPVEFISPEALGELARQRPVRLIDVRTPAEFQRFHARGATNVPLDRLDVGEVLNGSDEVVYFICRAGSRGREACEKVLALHPGARVVNVEGGTLAWKAARLPIVRPPKPWTPQKKIRVISLSLIALSVLLSIFVHRGLLGIAGLVGAALVFIGMTDVFGLGGVIGKQAWNRRKTNAESEAKSGAG